MLDKLFKDSKNKEVYKNLVFVGIASLIAVGLIYGFEIVRTSNSIPADLEGTYQKVADRSQTITDLINSARSKVQAVNRMNITTSSKQSAVSLVETAQSDIQKAEDEAYQMVEELKLLTKNIRSLEDPGDQQTAFQAISLEAQFLKEFFTFRDGINPFLSSLKANITPDSFSGNLDLSQDLSNMDSQNQRINTLNIEFLSRLGELGISPNS